MAVLSGLELLVVSLVLGGDEGGGHPRKKEEKQEVKIGSKLLLTMADIINLQVKSQGPTTPPYVFFCAFIRL